jgi:hypothetical protein
MNNLSKVTLVFVAVINICHGFTFTSNVHTRASIRMSNNDNYDLIPRETSGRNDIFKSLMSALVVVPTLTAAGIYIHIYEYIFTHICVYAYIYAYIYIHVCI